MTTVRPLNRQRLFNRPIAPAWMQASLDLATSGVAGPEGRELLDIALRDEDLAAVARSKVVESLHPVWINPPGETAAFIAYGRDHAAEAPDTRPLHLLALMATYPFFTDVMGTVGRLLHADGHVDAVHVRQRLKARWGDRDAVSVAQRKCILMLRWFEVLEGERGSGLSKAGVRFDWQGDWALWATAALLLGCELDMVDARTVETAPEFFFLDVRVPGRRDHPLLERATSGDRRVTYSLRRVPTISVSHPACRAPR